MKNIILILFTLYCRPGVLQSYENGLRYNLSCPKDNNKPCYFNLDIPQGSYIYTSTDLKDTTIFVVSDRDGLFLLKSTGNFKIQTNDNFIQERY